MLQDGTRQTRIPEWKIQASALRKSLGIAEHVRPWAACPRKYTGLKVTPRVLEMIELAAIFHLGSEKASAFMQLKQQPALLQRELAEVYVDVSQNPCRRPWTNLAGISKCLTTSSQIYSFKRDGVVLPLELMGWQGHRHALSLGSDMMPQDLKELAGQGISLPCLAVVIVSLAASEAFS